MQTATLRYCRIIVWGPAHEISSHLSGLGKDTGEQSKVCLKDVGKLLESMVAASIHP